MATDNATIDIEALISGRDGHEKLMLAIPKEVIKSGESGVISGFVSQGFSLTGAASWEGKQVGSSGDNAMNTGTAVLNSLGAEIGQGSMTTRAATQRRWVSSEPAAFQIEFILVAYRQGIDIRKDVAKLFRCVYPAGDALKGFGMKAPMGYTPAIGSAKNTATLRIGKWFQADGLLIDDVSAEFSREVTQDGFPLFANVSVSLSPYRMLYGDDMAGFLSAG